MTLRYAVANGNWSAPATWDGGTLPGAGDDVYANNKAVTIDQNVAVLSLRSTAASGITAGGFFNVIANRTINANIYAGGGNTVTVSSPNVTLTTAGTLNGGTLQYNNAVTLGSSDCVLNHTGDVYGGTYNNPSTATIGIGGIRCTVNLVGNIYADYYSGIYSSQLSTTVNVTGDVYSGGAGKAGSGINLGGNGAVVLVNGGLNPGVAVQNTQHPYALNVSGVGGGGSVTVNGVCGPDAVAYGGNGTCTVNPANPSSCGPGFSMSGSGTFTVTGNMSAQGLNNCVAMSGSGVMNVIGNLTAGAAGHGAIQSGAGTLNITGNVIGNSQNTQGYCGLYHFGAGISNVYGDATAGNGGGSGGTGVNPHGAYLAGTNGQVNVYGTAYAINTQGSTYGAYVNGTNTPMFVQIAKANDYPNAAATAACQGAVCGTASGSTLTIDAAEFGSGGVVPISGRVFIRDAGTNFVKMRQSNLGAVTVIGEVANDYPAPAHVRSGISFDFGAKVGTLAVPPAGSVALGVPVDAGVGTAVLNGATAAQVWAYATRSLTDKDGFALTASYDAAKTASQFDADADTVAHVTLVDVVTDLTHAPDVPTPAEIATQVRAELATELARVDQAVSAPKTLTGAYDAAKASASSTELAAAVTFILSHVPEGLTASEVWAYATRSLTQDVGLSPELTARLENCATVQTTGDQIAAMGV